MAFPSPPTFLEATEVSPLELKGKSSTPTPRKPTLAEVKDAICAHLEDIKRMFTDGARVAILVRNPGTPNGESDLFITDDEDELVLEAIRRLMADSTALNRDAVPFDPDADGDKFTREVLRRG